MLRALYCRLWTVPIIVHLCRRLFKKKKNKFLRTPTPSLAISSVFLRGFLFLFWKHCLLMLTLFLSLSLSLSHADCRASTPDANARSCEVTCKRPIKERRCWPRKSTRITPNRRRCVAVSSSNLHIPLFHQNSFIFVLINFSVAEMTRLHIITA